MAINKEKYISKYIDEGLDNISLIEGLVFDIKDGISIEDDLAALLRALHTLKGSSRMMEFERIEELNHALESVFIAIKEQRIGLSENAMKLILAVLDLIKSGFAIVQQTKNDSIEINEYVKNLNALASNDEFTIPETDFMTDKTLLESHHDQSTISKNLTSEEKDSQVIENKTSVKEAKSDSIRLSLDKIDDIIKSIASLQSLEISTKTISINSSALNNLIKDFYVKLKGIVSSAAKSSIDKNIILSLIEDFRKLDRFSERVNSSLKNHSIDAGNSIRSAYDAVISLRTVPLSTILDNYPRYVFKISDELGKKVHLSIEGKENEIDKNVIESLSVVFMHMVRNAIDHGIETPNERIAAGKNETGKLVIACSRESGNMKIRITDDGCGIDYERIRARAVKEGFVSEIAAASLSKEELTNIIFQSGFSTSGKLSNVSGRGVGMNVVRESIEAMKGSIIVESVKGKGTEFTFIVPLSIAALMGFPITSGGMKFIIPANFVDTTLLISSDDIITVVDRPQIKYNDKLIKLYYLSQILQIKSDSIASDNIFAVIIHAYDELLALVVDDINAMRSVVLKTMPAFMEKMPVFSGIVFNEDYEIVSALHIPTVMKMAKRIKTIDLKKRNIDFEKLRKSILVVDDSLPTREIEKEILSSEGYLVDMAADGSEALKAVKTKHYDLICTDINMPVMDGFMLIENIKKNAELSDIPIIVISSRQDVEDQKRAAMLGASRYIVKNMFNNNNLLTAVKDLIGGINE